MRFSTIVIEPQVGVNELHFNFGHLALQTLPKDLRYVYELEVDNPFADGGATPTEEEESWLHLADVIFSVDDVEFHCHKVRIIITHNVKYRSIK